MKGSHDPQPPPTPARLRSMTSLSKPVCVLVCVLVSLAGCRTAAESGAVTRRGETSVLTAQELALAVSVAQAEAQADEASIDSATARATTGRLSEQETRRACGRDRLLSIKLIGGFQNIPTTGHLVGPGESIAPDDFTVHAVLLTVRPDDGSVCLKGVQTGKVEPEPGSTELNLQPAP